MASKKGSREFTNFSAEYIWLDADKNIRMKTKIIYESHNAGPFPEWNYDGSSTGQAKTGDSEILLVPVRVFRQKESLNVVILCETYKEIKLGNGKYKRIPTESNTRHEALKVFENPQVKSLKPTFGLEQEFFLVDKYIKMNNGSDDIFVDYITPTTKHYCGAHKTDSIESAIIHKFADFALGFQIKISGHNAEVAKHQWEYQIGPVTGIEAADQMIMARYIIQVVASKNGYNVNFHPKPFDGVNGSGCHTNFSNKITMNGTSNPKKSGLQIIKMCIDKLKAHHKETIKLYGKDNDKRMTGTNETSSYDKFSWSVGGRDVSIRVPNQVEKDGCGYFEDRRPASNCDPYVVTSHLAKLTTPGYKEIVSEKESESI